MRALSYHRLWILLFVAVGTGCDMSVTTDVETNRRESRGVQPVTVQADESYQIDLGDTRIARATPADADTVALCFCVDVSTSMNGRIDGRRKADISKQAMRRTITHLDEYAKSHPEKKILVSLVDFGKTPRLVQSMVPFDKDSLLRVVQSLRTREGTAVGDAMEMGIREIESTPAAIQAIIVMTDGQNNRGAAPASVMHAAARNSVRPQAATSGIKVWLVAFDVKASLYEAVKDAGAVVVESRDQASLENMMLTAVQRVLAEDPRNL